jgi:hypothetical protein
MWSVSPDSSNHGSSHLTLVRVCKCYGVRIAQLVLQLATGWGSNPGGGKGCSLLHIHPVLPCGSPCLVNNGHRNSCLGVRQPRHDPDHAPPLRIEFRNEWSYTTTAALCLHGTLLGGLSVCECYKQYMVSNKKCSRSLDGKLQSLKLWSHTYILRKQN